MAQHPRLENLLNRKRESSQDNDLCRTLTLFMKEFGYTPEEMGNIPIPTFNIMLDEWNKEQKRQEKEMKKGARKGRRR